VNQSGNTLSGALDSLFENSVTLTPASVNDYLKLSNSFYAYKSQNHYKIFPNESYFRVDVLSRHVCMVHELVIFPGLFVFIELLGSDDDNFIGKSW
jgi:hypothetical protein